MTRSRIPFVAKLQLALVAIFFLAAPTAGDIGGCGQKDDDLDPKKFFDAKQVSDCQRCVSCGFTTMACARACQRKAIGGSFPTGCFPLVHDGEVCLHALSAASCGDYKQYVADDGATAPTECDFCPAAEK